MPRTVCPGRMMHRFEHSSRLGCRARIWRGLSVWQRRPITSEDEDCMKKAWILPGIAILVLSGCNRNAEPEGTIFVSGRIDGDTVDISSKIAGRIVELMVREGDSVK